MGNEQSSNNKYRKENVQKQKQKEQDLDSSNVSSHGLYQRNKQIQQPQIMFQPRDKKEMSIIKRNQQDISVSRVNRNKSSNIRSQVSFDDQMNKSVLNRSVSPSRSQLLVSSMRQLDRQKMRRRNQVQREEKLDLIRRATEFCVDNILQSVEYDNSSYINSMPILTGMVTSQNINDIDKKEDTQRIKDLMKNKTKEELYLRSQMKQYHPFKKDDKFQYSKMNNSFVEDKYGDDPYLKQQQTIASLLQSRPYFSQSNQNDNNIITLNPFEKEIEISEIKPPNRQTFKPLVAEKSNKNEENKKIDIKDFFLADQQLSNTTARKSVRTPKPNDEVETAGLEGSSPFSNLFQKAVSQIKKNDEYIGIMPVKSNAEVMEQKQEKPQLNTSIYLNNQQNDIHNSKDRIYGSSISKPNNEYNTPSSIIKKTIEINERIIENNYPISTNYDNNNNFNNDNYNNSNQYPNNNSVSYGRPLAGGRGQIQDQDQKYAYNMQQPNQYINQHPNTRLDYKETESLNTGHWRDNDQSSSNLKNPSQNTSAIQQKPGQVNFYPTTEKLKVKVKKIEVLDNSYHSQYDASSESEEENVPQSNLKGMKLRQFEEQQSEKKNKNARKENNATSNNQSYLDNSQRNINLTSTSQQRNPNNGYANNETINNSYLSYNYPDTSPLNKQHTPTSPFNQKYNQPSSFTTHQVEYVENINYNNQYPPKSYQPDRIQEYDPDQVKPSTKFPQYDNPNSIQQQQQQIYNSNTRNISQYMEQPLNNNINNNNNQNITPRQQQTFIDQSLKYSNNQQTFSPQFSQNQQNNLYQPQDYPVKTVPLHAPDIRERANPNSTTPRNGDYQNMQPMSMTPRSNRQPIFSNHSSQQNSIQVNPTKFYDESQYQPQQPILNKQVLNPQNYEKIVDIKLNESRTEFRNLTPSTPIYQSQTPREYKNPPSTSQILNQSYSNINQSQKMQYPDRRNITPPPPQRNENIQEKVTTTTTTYQHGVQPIRNQNQFQQNEDIPSKNYDQSKNDRPIPNIYDIEPSKQYNPQQPQYYPQQQQYQPYQQQQLKPQPQQYQQPQQKEYKPVEPIYGQNPNIQNSKINQSRNKPLQQKIQQEEITNVFIADSPPQSQREIARIRSLNNSRASSKKKKQRKKTPGRKQNYERSDNSSDEPSVASSIYHQEDNDNFSDDFEDNSRTNQSYRKSNKSKTNTSYSKDRMSRQSRHQNEKNNNPYENGNQGNKNNKWSNNGNRNDEDDDNQTERTKKARKSDKQNEYPYDQSKIIRTNVEQIKQLYQSTQEEQPPPYDDYYDNKNNYPNQNKQNYQIKKNNERDPNNNGLPQPQFQGQRKMINKNIPTHQESETEEDDLQQQPLSISNHRQPNNSQKQYNNTPNQGNQYSNQDPYQQNLKTSENKNRQENVNQSQQIKRMANPINQNEPNYNNSMNYNQQQPYQVNTPQQNGQRFNTQPKQRSDQSRRIDYKQNNNNTYHHDSDSDTDQGMPHQEIDKHAYPGNQSLSQSQIKRSQKGQSGILPQNINDDYLRNQNQPYEQQYSEQKQRAPLQKQQSEAMLNNRNYIDNSRNQQPQQYNNWQNNAFQNNNSPYSSQVPQYQQQQQFNQNDRPQQLQKVQSDANFLKNKGGMPPGNNQYNNNPAVNNQYNQPQLNSNSNLPKVLQDKKVKVKVQQNQNNIPHPQINQSISKEKQQQQAQYQPKSNRSSHHNQQSNKIRQINHQDDQDDDDPLHMMLDLSNQNYINPQNRTSNTIDFYDNEFNDETVKVQLTLDEIMRKDDSGFLNNQDDLLNSDASSQQGNYLNALNQNLQQQNKYLL